MKYHMQKTDLGYGEIYYTLIDEDGIKHWLTEFLIEDKIYDVEIKDGNLIIVGVEQS